MEPQGHWIQPLTPRAALIYLLEYPDSPWEYSKTFNSSFQLILWLFCMGTWTTSGDAYILEAVNTFWYRTEKISEVTDNITNPLNGHAKTWKELSKTVRAFCSAYPPHPCATFYVPLASWQYRYSLFSIIPFCPNTLHEQSGVKKGSSLWQLKGKRGRKQSSQRGGSW